jgi:hypothetical protein
MGTFAKTAILNYLVLFANQGKQTSVFRFRLQQTNGSFPIMFSVCSRQMVVAVFSLVLFSVCNIVSTEVD